MAGKVRRDILAHKDEGTSLVEDEVFHKFDRKNEAVFLIQVVDPPLSRTSKSMSMVEHLAAGCIQGISIGVEAVYHHSPSAVVQASNPRFSTTS